MLQLDAVDLSFERPLFSNLSFNVPRGAFFTLLGSNGAGKSTLFKVICGEQPVNRGQALLDGRSIFSLSIQERAGLIAQVKQDPKVGTIAEMTVEENLSLAYKRGQNRSLAFFSSTQRRTLFKKRLSFLDMGLEERLSEEVGRLSGGQRQALSLVMALIQGANLLLLDEITAALDPDASKTLLTLTRRMVKEMKMTTLMITHNKEDTSFSDDVFILKNGQVTKF